MRAPYVFLRLGYQAASALPRAEVRNMDLQLRQAHRGPGRRLPALWEIGDRIEDFPQKAVLFLAHFANGRTRLAPHSVRLMGCRMTVFSFSGLVRRASLR